MRSQKIVEQRDGQRAARAEKPFHDQTENDPQAVWPGVELRGKQFLALQDIEQGIGQAERAAELAPATRKRCALLARLCDTDGHIGRVRDFIEPDVHVFVADLMEVTRFREPGKSQLEAAFVERLALCQTDTTPEIAIAEAVVAEKFDMTNSIGRRVAECDAQPGGMAVDVKGTLRFHGSLRMGRIMRTSRLRGDEPKMAKIFCRFCGIGGTDWRVRNRKQLARVLAARSGELRVYRHRADAIERSSFNRHSDRKSPQAVMKWRKQPASRLGVVNRAPRIANARFREAVVLIINEQLGAIFRESCPRENSFPAPRSKERPRRCSRHLAKQRSFGHLRVSLEHDSADGEVRAVVDVISDAERSIRRFVALNLNARLRMAQFCECRLNRESSAMERNIIRRLAEFRPDVLFVEQFCDLCRR